MLSQLPHRPPRATYRLQITPTFPLAAAAALVAYLDDLGISDVYTSPILTARAGSSHGYDITDHGQISPDLGGQAAFEQLSAALAGRDLGLILDVVPNHMGIGDARNGWWLDVLENGPASIFAPYFDVDWDPVPAQLRDKVLLPVLGGQYGDVLEAGELRLRYEGGAFFLNYYEHTFPLAPRSYSEMLSYQLDDLIQAHGADDPTVIELQSILTALSYLPQRGDISREKILERNREKEVIKRRLRSLVEGSPPVLAAIQATIARYNGAVGDPASFDLLDALIAQQPYRLAYWRVAAEEINYRRFFDINDLAAIRVELPEVLQATHQLIFRLLADGQASGLRIDHPDGLWSPPAYFRQLQESYLSYWTARRLAGADGAVSEDAAEEARAWIEAALGQPTTAAEATRWPLYVVAEKILSDGESLPEDWAVEGTTGYDFLNEVNGIFVDQSARRALDRLYTDVAGPQPAFANLVNAKKKEIMLVSLASEINTLSHMLDGLTERNRHYRDFTLNSLTFAIREVIACLPVYRTYISGPGTVTPRAERSVEAAVREAKRRNPRTAETIFNFIADTLLLRNLSSFDEAARDEVLRFVMKFQQITGPVMAKGVEDTTFYVYNRLIALNEVGGHPEHFGTSVAEMHRRAAERAARWPHALLATSTHDTKRSEDVRARIHVLSEMPREWRQAVGRWSRLNQRKKTEADGQPMPSRNDEYLLYQTLVGAWPDMGADLAAFCLRIAQYMEKATREAKVHTSWVNPNEAYDAAVRRFVEGILDPRRSKRFLESLAALAERAAYFGRFNSLAQTLIKLTAPGVPDIYQGCELWDLSLVDPDNRRSVDYSLRQRLLAELQERMGEGDLAGLAADLLQSAADGRVKLYVTYGALCLRRERPGLFTGSEYLPLGAEGERAAHVVAFARRGAGGEAVSVAPRLCLGLAGGERRPPVGELWGNT
ncbi:MAG: malto-oligosyltrehalose synthase, partial [Chloroflexales bacterium]|nr:malto-oligosyltrehalose synthase [Chloroflexales bacterium]